MSKNRKIWLTLAAVLVLVGAVLLGIAMAQPDWELTSLSTGAMETNTHGIEGEFQHISLQTDTADLRFVLSDGPCRVECRENSKVTHQVTVENNTLKVTVQDNRKWYEHISFCFETPRITVWLPSAEYGALTVSTQTGAVEIPEDFTFDRIDVTGNTGSVINRADATGSIRIGTSTGSIRLEQVNAASVELSVSTGSVTASQVICPGDMTVRVSTGKTQLTDLSCKNFTSTGDTGSIVLTNVIAEELLSVRRDTGSVRLVRVDGGEILIRTDTGSVTGSLLSDKVFIVKTDTGHVSVPSSVTGGKCQITTDTGDVRLTVDAGF